MSYDLSKIIYDYIKKNKVPDENFYEKQLEIIIREKDINSYISDIRFITKPKKINGKDAPASYEIGTGKITICPQLLNETALDYAYDSYLTGIDKKLYFYIMATHILLHETEHANQEKKINMLSDLESLILLESVPFFKMTILEENGRYFSDDEVEKIMENYNKSYIENYCLSPLERIANISSSKIDYNIGLEFSNSSIQLNTNLLLDTYNYYVGAYELQKEPTKYFIQHANPYLGEYAIIEEISRDLSQEDRMMFGLKVEDGYKQYIGDTAKRLEYALRQ